MLVTYSSNVSADEWFVSRCVISVCLYLKTWQSLCHPSHKPLSEALVKPAQDHMVAWCIYTQIKIKDIRVCFFLFFLLFSFLDLCVKASHLSLWNASGALPFVLWSSMRSSLRSGRIQNSVLDLPSRGYFCCEFVVGVLFFCLSHLFLWVH